MVWVGSYVDRETYRERQVEIDIQTERQVEIDIQTETGRDTHRDRMTDR